MLILSKLHWEFYDVTYLNVINKQFKHIVCFRENNCIEIESRISIQHIDVSAISCELLYDK